MTWHFFFKTSQEAHDLNVNRALLDVRCSLLGGSFFWILHNPAPCQTSRHGHWCKSPAFCMTEQNICVHFLSRSVNNTFQLLAQDWPSLHPLQTCLVPNHALSLFTVSCTGLLPYVPNIILAVNSLMMCGVKCSALTSEAKCVKSRYINFTLMDFISHSAESHGD